MYDHLNLKWISKKNVERETFSNKYFDMSSRTHMNPGYIPKHLELTSSYVKGDAISFLVCY